MRAFVVEDRVINAIVNYLRIDSNGAFRRKTLKESGYDLEDKSFSGCIKLAQAMHDLNDNAVNERYSDKPADEFHPEPFIFQKFSGIERIPALKALSCWLYQCSEGDVPNDPLFKLMEKIHGEWAYLIVSDLPAYKNAAWGYEHNGVCLTDLKE